MATKRLTKEEIVRETALFYNSKNRGFDDNVAACCYTDINGNHCAVGRCMLPKKRPTISSGDNTDTIDKIVGDNPDLDHILKAKYRGHEFQFWNTLQRLHDESLHWTDEGISDRGKQYILDTFGVKL